MLCIASALKRIGVRWASQNAAISSNGEVFFKALKLTNDTDGVQMLSSHPDSLPDVSFIINLESTAHYGDNLVRYLANDGHKGYVISPIQTSTLRKNNIRKTKTDKVDTYIIAKALLLQQSHRFVTVDEIHLMFFKALGRFRQKSLNQHIRLKIQLKTYIDQTFSEIRRHSS